MRHAGDDTLKALEPLFVMLRKLEKLKEKKAGIYYLKSKAFLHFHDDDGKVFADVRIHPPEFDRLPATTQKDQQYLLRVIKEHLD